MELLVGALQEPAFAERAAIPARSRMLREQRIVHCGREFNEGVASASGRRPPASQRPASRRGPVTGVNGTAIWSLGNSRRRRFQKLRPNRDQRRILPGNGF